MGYPQGHKEKTRQGILGAARKLWKSQGYSGASVDKVMEEAGLTRGGFYAHFKSKEDLFVHALSETLAVQYIEALRKEGVEDVVEQRRRVIEEYLSVRHCEHPERGCPLTALSQEAPRVGATARQVIAKQVRRFAGWLAQDGEKEKGLACLALMVGAVTLARASAEDDVREDLLKAAQKGVFQLLGPE